MRCAYLLHRFTYTIADAIIPPHNIGGAVIEAGQAKLYKLNAPGVNNALQLIGGVILKGGSFAVGYVSEIGSDSDNPGKKARCANTNALSDMSRPARS